MGELQNKIIALHLLLGKTCDKCARSRFGQQVMKQCPKIDKNDELDPIPTCDFYVGKVHKW
jgi:hypothetical protein